MEEEKHTMTEEELREYDMRIRKHIFGLYSDHDKAERGAMWFALLNMFIFLCVAAGLYILIAPK